MCTASDDAVRDEAAHRQAATGTAPNLAGERMILNRTGAGKMEVRTPSILKRSRTFLDSSCENRFRDGPIKRKG